jgi:hypothetical protein
MNFNIFVTWGNVKLFLFRVWEVIYAPAAWISIEPLLHKQCRYFHQSLFLCQALCWDFDSNGLQVHIEGHGLLFWSPPSAGTHLPPFYSSTIAEINLIHVYYTILLTYCTIMSIIVHVGKEITLLYSIIFYNAMVPPYFSFYCTLFYIKYQITSQSYITKSFYQIIPSFLTVTPLFFTLQLTLSLFNPDTSHTRAHPSQSSPNCH